MDWGHFGNWAGPRLYAFALTLCRSRMRYVEFTRRQDVETSAIRPKPANRYHLKTGLRIASGILTPPGLVPSRSMANVLNEEKKQQVLALERLGWSLRQIQKATRIRRETASQYLKAAGIAVRRPGGLGRRSERLLERRKKQAQFRDPQKAGCDREWERFNPWTKNGGQVKGLTNCGAMSRTVCPAAFKRRAQ